MANLKLVEENQKFFWGLPDKKQSQLLKYIIVVFAELQDEIQTILSRFPTFDGKLTKRELEWLYRTIDKHAELDFYGNNVLKLYLQNLNRRIHIQRDYAFDVLVAAAFMRVYVQIFDEAKIYNDEIFRQKYKWYMGQEYTKAIPAKYYTEPLPSGNSPQDMINNEALFRVSQVSSVIKAQRISDPQFNDIAKKPIKLEFERAKNALLKESDTHGYHGIMDVIMAAMVGYAAMAALEVTNAETYSFFNPQDGRTTDICNYLSQIEKFPVSEARFGYTVPPIFMDKRTNMPIPHSCRSWIRINY